MDGVKVVSLVSSDFTTFSDLPKIIILQHQTALVQKMSKQTVLYHLLSVLSILVSSLLIF